MREVRSCAQGLIEGSLRFQGSFKVKQPTQAEEEQSVLREGDVHSEYGRKRKELDGARSLPEEN